MKKYKIYIAGPYSEGDTVVNIRKAIHTAEVLIESGVIPYVPHLNHLWHLVSEHGGYTYWMRMDLEWLKCCDGLLRISGESKGAEIEVEKAKKLNIPVFGNYYQLKSWIRKQEDGKKDKEEKKDIKKDVKTSDEH